MVTAMLKREELSVLDRAIRDLGPESYLGPWLQSVRAEVTAAITSDLEPAMLPHEAYQLAQKTIGDARLEADRLASEATANAQKTIADARSRIDTFRTRARQELERLAGQI